MNGSPRHTPAIAAKFQFLTTAKWLLSLLVITLFTAATPYVPSQNTDQQYIQIMNLIDRADALRKSGKTDAAKAKYKQAESALILFKRSNPLFAPKAISYRLAEVTDRLEARPPLPSASEPTSVKPQVNLEAAAKASGTKSSIKLLDPGKEPRTLLRLHPQVGEKQAVLLTLKLNMDMPGMTGQNAPKIPELTFPADVSIEKVAPNGDITFDFVIGEGGLGTNTAGLPPQAIAGAKMAFASVKGLSVSMLMSSHGSGQVVDVKAPPGAAPQIEEAITKAKESISTMHTASPIMALPEEPVGQGAKWQVKTTAKSNGMDVDQTATFQLTSIDGDHISVSKTVDFTVKGTPQPGKSGPPMPMPMQSMNMSGKLTATSAMDLSKLIPLQSSWDGEFAINMSMKTPKGNMPMAMKANMNLLVESH